MITFLLAFLLAFTFPWSVQPDRTAVQVGDTVVQTLAIVPPTDGATTVMITTGRGLAIDGVSGFSGVVTTDVSGATWELNTTANVSETLTISMRVTPLAQTDLDVVTVYRWGDQTLAQALSLMPRRWAYHLPLVVR